MASISLSTAGTTLTLTNPGSGINVTSIDFPVPERNVLFAQSIDTEGGQAVARQYQNRQIPITVRCFDVSVGGGQMDARVKQLQQVVGRIAGEGGGTLTYVAPTSGTINFTVEDVTVKVPTDPVAVVGKSALCEVNITARPIGYGVEGSVASWSETTGPVLRGTVSGVQGDLDGWGRLVVNNDQAGQDQLWMQWGLRSRNYGTAASNALFYEAETRLLQGGAFLAARSGASGGTVARQGTLTTTYQSMLSLASSGTAYLSHVGPHQVMARVYDPGGTAGRTSGGTLGSVALALEYAQGDFLQVTRNDPVSPAVINEYSIVNLGQVNISQVASGTQRWDGRIIAKSANAGDAVDVDYVWLVPVDEGSGQARGGVVYTTPSVFTARDEFNLGGTLNGKALPVGGNWAVSGGTAVDWNMSSGVAERGGAVNDGSSYRVGIAGATALTDTLVGIDLFNLGAAGVNNDTAFHGVVARYTDANNNVIAAAQATTGRIWVTVTVGGTVVLSKASDTPITFLGRTWYTLRFVVDSAGRFFALWCAQGGDPLVVMAGSHSSLATGGTLASGKAGIAEKTTTTGADYDNFILSTWGKDAAVYASQSLELRSDRIGREDSSGTLIAPLHKYEGDYLLIPPSGQESRTSEFIIKMSRNDPLFMGDPGIDDLSAQLFVTPRWLNVPES